MKAHLFTVLLLDAFSKHLYTQYDDPRNKERGLSIPGPRMRQITSTLALVLHLTTRRR